MSSKQEKYELPITSSTISFLSNYSHMTNVGHALKSFTAQLNNDISFPEKGYTVILTIAVNYSTTGHSLSGCIFRTCCKSKAATGKKRVILKRNYYNY